MVTVGTKPNPKCFTQTITAKTAHSMPGTVPGTLRHWVS